MEYLKKWIEYLVSQPSLTLKRPLIVEGACKKHLGPRLEYAVIEIMIEPSDALIVEFSKELLEMDEYSRTLLDVAIFGIFDIIMVTKTVPLRKIKINFLNADIHPIDSNRAAFLKAGRDAGYKIINAIEKVL